MFKMAPIQGSPIRWLTVFMSVWLMASLAAAQSNETSDRLQDLEEQVACMRNTLDSIGISYKPRDCRDVYHHGNQVNGVYMIWPSATPIYVVCNFDDDGQWIVLHRRVNGVVNFQKDWASYRDGFGRMDYNSNFWLGLQRMHQLTHHQMYTLRIDMEDWDGRQKYAEYSVFYIMNESANYAIYYDGHSGTAIDKLGDHHRGRPFTTTDRDNDLSYRNCADQQKGPWWHNNCDMSNLNGEYGEYKGAQGMEWGNVIQKTSSMRIRPTADL